MFKHLLTLALATAVCLPAMAQTTGKSENPFAQQRAERSASLTPQQRKDRMEKRQAYAKQLREYGVKERANCKTRSEKIADLDTRNEQLMKCYNQVSEQQQQAMEKSRPQRPNRPGQTQSR